MNRPSIVTASWLLALILCGRGEGGDEVVWPLPDWPRATPEEMGMDARGLEKAREYALRGGGSGVVVRSGRRVFSWGPQEKRYSLKSTTKSIGVTALGLALKDGKLQLEDRAVKYHPTLAVPPEENRKSGWIGEITIRHLAAQTAGFEKPGGYTRLKSAPGSRWSYSDGGPNWLAECLTLLYRVDLRTLLFERVFTPLGISPEQLQWRDNAYRPSTIEGISRREFGSGIRASVDAMARLGYLYLRRGEWNGVQIVPRSFVDAARTASVAGLPVEKPETYFSASDHYGLLWWNNADGALRDVPRDAYWSWGLYDSLILVIPSLDLVAARAGKRLPGGGSADYEIIRPFLAPLCAAAVEPVPRCPAPCPPSPVIRGLSWAPAASIVRLAKGSDNWPIAWGADGDLYTAYGDGWGFEPRVPSKLSLGIARVSGSPPDLRGWNIRSPSGEQKGDGAAGKKASGMLMVDGVLYMWVRNAGNSQLASSRDRGRTWTWSEWKFQESFGYPTFLNFGRNYEGARDDCVYVYSPDSASAYEPAARLLLARAPRRRIETRAAYEFFKGRDSRGEPVWTGQLSESAAVFRHRRRCYRPAVTYCAPLRRYLLCQPLPGADTRYRGGLAIYDAPEPWGPWTTVYRDEAWDVGPGESARFPTKWLSADGKTLYLLFSGDDSFSVRQATLTLSRGGG